MICLFILANLIYIRLQYCNRYLQKLMIIHRTILASFIICLSDDGLLKKRIFQVN